MYKKKPCIIANTSTIPTEICLVYQEYGLAWLNTLGYIKSELNFISVKLRYRDLSHTQKFKIKTKIFFRLIAECNTAHLHFQVTKLFGTNYLRYIILSIFQNLT